VHHMRLYKRKFILLNIPLGNVFLLTKGLLMGDFRFSVRKRAVSL
jgi:hypothetical protein